VTAHRSRATRPPLVIVNPRASRLADATRRDRLRADLERRLTSRFGMAPDWAPETHAGARAALTDLNDRPLVVVAGGDGTIREAAAALAGGTTPLAIVPGGTGNVLAGTLRIRGIGPALDVVTTGRSRRLDLGLARWVEPDGVVHDRHFTVAAGMGFDARIMAAAEHEWKRRLKFGAYVGATVRELARLQPAHFRIVADGDRLEIDGLLVLVGNCGDLIPGRLGARQPLDPSDGRLDLLVVGGRDILAGLRGAVDLLWRTGQLDDHVIRRAVSHVRVEAAPAQPIQTDGDVHPASWLEAHVLPGALHVLVPGA
jgi:diacylglycerol kinase (ATP)